MAILSPSPRAGNRWRPAVVSSAAFLALMAPATAAAGQTGEQRVVGPPSAVSAGVLPADPRLWGPYRRASVPDPCVYGSIACVDRTIATMTARLNKLAPQCDHNAVFSLLYLRTTEEYRDFATTPGNFIAPRKVNRENTIFAQLYFRADVRWHDDQPLTVPRIWRLAFAAADAREVQGVGDAFLGMAAHIKRDLPFALWRIGMGQRSDHLAVNTMLEQVYPKAATELGRRFDPGFTPGAIVPGTGKTLVAVIATWRDQAWRDAQDLVNAQTDAEWNAVADRIEDAAWQTGVEIYLGTKYTPQSATAVRDTYCSTHWNS